MIVKEDGTIIGVKGKPLKTYRSFAGYEYITTYLNGKSKKHSVHRLVAIKYVPNPFNKPCVNHKDGNKQNNHKDNLEWVTHKENTRHAFNVGLMDNKHRTNHLRNRLILELYLDMKYNMRELAIIFETTPENISAIISP